VIASINNNVGDEDFSNNYVNNSFTDSHHFDQNQVVLKIRTDDYGKETYWELHDDVGNVLEHGGNQLVGPNGGGAFPLGINAGPGAYSNNTLIKDTLNLPENGCYSIHFVDAYGDGMCCNYGNGYYKLYNIDIPSMPIIVSGQFEAYDRHAFSVGSVTQSVESEKQLMGIQILPNPASDLIYVEVESPLSGILTFGILNAMGQTVVRPQQVNLALGSNEIAVSLEGLSDGLYFFTATTEEGRGRGVQKFLVHH
jgi:hypothetical protein